LKIMVMKNRCLGMIREIQDKRYAGNRFAIELGGLPDLERLAEAYGVEYMSIGKNEQIGAVADAVLKAEHAVLVECMVPHDAPTLRFGGERGLHE
ncbi:MAG TPA: thiamine pyrophosphate-dependent enzyme, partial [Oscillospiraceae bacterium]|nr:thiamine pyrophosphate-dependent enzyme [Oscillospiraceae bacterium]